MQYNQEILKGVFPAIPTCFTDEGEIDLDAQKKVISFAIAAGANGIVFPGVASEYKYLTADERGQLIRQLVDEVAGRIPVVAGISETEPDLVIALGKEAMNNGVQYLMLMAPTHLGLDTSKHADFFGKITRELPGGQIILQNAPHPIGAGLSADALIQITSQISAIRYIKEETLPSGPTITALIDADIPHLLGVFGGGGARYIIDELNRGAVGAVPAIELTDLHASLVDAYASGNLAEARRLYGLSLPLLTAQKIYRMRLTKYVLHKRGVVNNQYLRATLPTLDQSAMIDIDHILEDLQNANALPWSI